MGLSLFNVESTFWLFITIICLSNGQKVQLFGNYDFTGLINEITPTEKCYSNPKNMQTYSFITDDCIVTYWDPECKSKRFTRHDPGSYSTTTDSRYAIESFHLCNDQDGGSQLNVDLTEYLEEKKTTDTLGLLEKYTGVCTCINIPDYIQKMNRWSINNHANELKVYFEPECMENKFYGKLFPPKYNEDNRNIFNLTRIDNVTKKIYRVQSFGPYKNSKYFKTSCLLTELRNNVSILEQKLRRIDSQVTVTHSGIENVKKQPSNDTVELANKFIAVNTKVITVKNSVEEEHIIIQDEISQSINSIKTDITELEDLRSNALVILAEKFHEMDIKLNDILNDFEDKLKVIKFDVEILSSFINASKGNIENLRNTSMAKATGFKNQLTVNIKVENLTTTLKDKLNESRAGQKTSATLNNGSQIKDSIFDVFMYFLLILVIL